MPSELTATFEVVTPLFLGGADPARTVELRPTSIKGALRFWWRALAWSKHADLKKVHEEERKLFGAAGDDRRDGDAIGQSSFGVRVWWPNGEPPILNETEVRALTRGRSGTSYLSYGIINRGKEGPRCCYENGHRLVIKLIPLHGDGSNSQKEIQSVVEGVKLFGLLGSLGGRSRRGWGSIALTKLEGAHNWQAPQTLQAYRDALACLLAGTRDANSPPYSAFSKRSRVLVIDGGNDPLAALNDVGELFQDFRRQHRTCEFGLPHRRFADGTKRRASPLFFHVHKLNRGHAIAATLLPAPFIPGGSKDQQYAMINAFLAALRTEWAKRKREVQLVLG